MQAEASEETGLGRPLTAEDEDTDSVMAELVVDPVPGIITRAQTEYVVVRAVPVELAADDTEDDEEEGAPAEAAGKRPRSPVDPPAVEYVVVKAVPVEQTTNVTAGGVPGAAGAPEETAGKRPRLPDAEPSAVELQEMKTHGNKAYKTKMSKIGPAEAFTKKWTKLYVELVDLGPPLGTGVVARCEINADVTIFVYGGDIIKNDDVKNDHERAYGMTFTCDKSLIEYCILGREIAEKAKLDPATHLWEAGSLLSHRCRNPNCHFVLLKDERNTGGTTTVIRTLKKIAKGEELTVTYSSDFPKLFFQGGVCLCEDCKQRQ
jgi:hypothetical protein